MKKLRLVSAFSLLILFAACSGDQQSETSNLVILSGKLHQASNDLVKIDYLNINLLVDTLDAEGAFHISFELPEASYLKISNSKQYFMLYARPGDSLYLELDMLEPYVGYRVDGDRPAENAYLMAKDSLQTLLGTIIYIDFMHESPARYAQIRDSLMDELASLFQKHAAQSTFDSPFIALEEAYLRYKSMHMNQMYPMYHRHLTGEEVEEEEYMTEAEIHDMESADLGLASLLSASTYRSFVDQRIQRFAKQIEPDTTEADFTLRHYGRLLTATDSLLEQTEMRHYFKYKIMNSLLDSKGPTGIDDFMEDFRAEQAPALYTSELEKALEKWSLIKPGNTIPTFQFVNAEGDSVSFEELKGGLVYVDIWATWCAPCLAEHPHWDRLKESYADQPISFVAISIDDSRELWQKVLETEEMEGHQWFTDNAWQSDFTRHFSVNSIPRFLLLDADGKIIDPKADRPSGGIRQVIDRHLPEREKSDQA